MKAEEVNVNVGDLEVHMQRAPEAEIIPKLKIDPPIVIICHSKLRRWANQHALSLFFGNIYFITTWVVIILANRAW